MTNFFRSIATVATVGLNTASSAFAQDFGHPPLACYGQALGGHDQNLFNAFCQELPVPLASERR